MKDKGLFLFYLIFWVCGRIYIFADTYLYTKIFQSIGLHFDIICLVSYIIHITPRLNIGKRMFWVLFLYYEIMSALFYIYIQFTGDHDAKTILWSNGVNSSGAMILSEKLGIVQDLFIPFFIVFVIYLLWRRACELEKN